jgi:hypothetical protein
MMERVVLHGQRRAAEMREVADTLEELGVSHFMASATAEHQQLVADLGIKERFERVPEDRHAIAEAILRGQRCALDRQQDQARCLAGRNRVA